MDRRWTGCLILVAGLVAVLTMPQALHVDPLAGNSSAAPMPAPPPVGTCMLLDLPAKSRVVVPCDQPHHAEVTAVWTAEDPTRVSSATDDNCLREALRYTGVDALATIGAWTMPQMVASRVLVASPDERLNSYGWALCVMFPPTRETYLDSLRGPVSIIGFPDELATCADIVLVSTIDRISCDTPHLVQVLGLSWRTLGAGAVAAVAPGQLPLLPPDIRSELRAECFAIAAELTDVADPTWDGLLTIDSDIALFERAPADPTAGNYLALCSLISNGRPLTRSLIGFGDVPLPYS